MESKPVEVFPVHDYLRSRLCTLYENDSIFDRFECGWNGDDSYPNLSIISGNYILTWYWLYCRAWLQLQKSSSPYNAIVS